LLTLSSGSASIRRKVVSYSGGAQGFPWLSLVTGSVIDEAIVLTPLTFEKLMKDARKKVRSLKPDLAFVLIHPGEYFFSVSKKVMLLRLVGVNRNVYGWRKRANYSYFARTQFEEGRFEHRVMGPIRSIGHYPLVGTIEPSEIGFRLNANAEAETWAEDQWRIRGWDTKNVVALAPGAQMPHKQWPGEKYVSLGRLLGNLPNTAIIIIGTIQDRSLADEICSAIGENAISFAGAELAQSAALLKRCKLIVGNDGGAMHLGAAVGCPCVTIASGIEYPGSIEPWLNLDWVVRHPVPCSPCYSHWSCPKGHELCIREIRVEEVWKQVSSRLSALGI
jgi:ADP-heptose:LPS heptosyltransferase